jgi:hypothetical protein
MTAAERAAQINKTSIFPALMTAQEYWAADGIHTGANLDAWIEWNAWKQAYRHVRDCRAPASRWSDRSAQEWVQATAQLWAEQD